MTEGPDDLAPSLGASEGSLAPALGSRPPAGVRPWWRSLKGPIGTLIADLEHASAIERRRAAQALVRLGDRRAVPALAVAARDPAFEVRKAAIAALAALGGDGVREPLHRACQDGHPAVRLEAAAGLVAHGDRSSVVVLEALAEHARRFGLPADLVRVEAAIAGLRSRLAADS